MTQLATVQPIQGVLAMYAPVISTIVYLKTNNNVTVRIYIPVLNMNADPKL